MDPATPRLGSTPCFLRPLPLLGHQPNTHPPDQASRRPPRPSPTRVRRRRRTTLGPSPTAQLSDGLTLSQALHEIAAFRGTPPEARALAARLIDALVPAPSPGASPADDAAPRLFGALRTASLLPAFSSARPPPAAPVAQKSVSAARLAAAAGLPLAALAPRRRTVLAWQAAGVAAVAAVIQLTRAAGVEELARPALLALGALFAADQLVLRGAAFEGVYRALFPRYAEKVLRHEAGHFLAAYLHGLPVRGYVLSAAEAVRAGIPGQAGTLFSDDEMYGELSRGRLTNRAIDRYSIVSMAGIAAEAINYGEAEGGESDVAALLSLLTTLQPPWTKEGVRSQARWAVLEAILLLRRNERAFEALCDAMRDRKSLGECVRCIEDNFTPPDPPVESQDLALRSGVTESDLSKREHAILAELERIQKKVKQLDED